MGVVAICWEQGGNRVETMRMGREFLLSHREFELIRLAPRRTHYTLRDYA